MRVGMIGASGLMGHGMATNILAHGMDLSYTVNRREPEGLAEAGATKVDSHAELGRTCDVVLLCITTAQDVEAALTGPDGVLTDPKPGLVVIDASTSEPAVTERLAAAAQAKGAQLVDAPVTLGPAEAEAGTLNSLVGADDETYGKAEPVISAYSAKIIRCGAVGSGHVVKLLNTFVFQAVVNSIAEGFAVSAKAQVDPQLLIDILEVGSIGNGNVLGVMAKTLQGNYDAMTFQLDNARKDARYYTRLGGDVSVPTAIGDAVHESLGLASALGFGEEYVGSVVKAQEKLAGVAIRTEQPGD